MSGVMMITIQTIYTSMHDIYQMLIVIMALVEVSELVEHLLMDQAMDDLPLMNHNISKNLLLLFEEEEENLLVPMVVVVLQKMNVVGHQMPVIKTDYVYAAKNIIYFTFTARPHEGML